MAILGWSQYMTEVPPVAGKPVISSESLEITDENHLYWAQNSLCQKGFLIFRALARHVLIEGSRNIYIAISAYCANMQAMNITAEILPEDFRILEQ